MLKLRPREPYQAKLAWKERKPVRSLMNVGEEETENEIVTTTVDVSRDAKDLTTSYRSSLD